MSYETVGKFPDTLKRCLMGEFYHTFDSSNIAGRQSSWLAVLPRFSNLLSISCVYMSEKLTICATMKKQ